MIDINGHRAHRSVFADKIFHYSQFHCICNGTIASILNYSTKLHFTDFISILMFTRKLPHCQWKKNVWCDCCIWKCIFRKILKTNKQKTNKYTNVEQSLCKLEPTCWPSVHLMHQVTWQAAISPTSIQPGSPSISITSGYCGCLFTEQWDCFFIVMTGYGILPHIAAIKQYADTTRNCRSVIY